MSAALKVDLESLTAADRRELYDRLTYELQRDAERTVPVTSRIMWDAIQDAIEAYLDDDMPARRVPMSVIRKQIGNKRFDEAMLFVDEFVERSCGILMRRPQRVVVVRECLICLCQYLRSVRVPVTGLALVRNLDKLAGAVDRAFPGYAKAKLLHVVVTLKAK
jgi:hypothetical protein